MTTAMTAADSWRCSTVKPIAPGQSTGYGRRFIAERDGHIATLPIGYGDGLVRALANNCDVLIGGRRYPVCGMVSMDNITVVLAPFPPARPPALASRA